MKTRILTNILSLVLCVGLLTPHTAYTQVPGIINYQGRIVDGGTNFDGTGQFEFALVNSASGTTNYWSNDGTAAGQPSASVSLTVTKGLYSVLLGDTTIANMTASIAPAVFANSNVLLRVWFNDGVTGFQQLSPDQRLAAAGYALNAAMAQTAVSFLSSSDVTGQRLNVGVNNYLSATLATIAGGSFNMIMRGANYSTIGGGDGNEIANSATFSTIGGGNENGIGDIAYESTIGGGSQNGIGLLAHESTIGGGNENRIDGNASFSTIGGGQDNTIEDSDSFSTIGGGDLNTIQDNATFSTISGGDDNGIGYGAYESTIGGGAGNMIQNFVVFSTIGGGSLNTIQNNGTFSTIGGGFRNAIGANTYSATIGGGVSNNVDGWYATVPGGTNNTASGTASFAAGNSALATNDGAFVWADDSGGSFASTSSNQFSVRAAGGVRFFANAGATLSAQLAVNATAWSTLSDRNANENIQPINVRDILEELVSMPISQWNYRDDPTQRRYIGPMAQDFYSAFGLGDDDKRINTFDNESVALAAIQGLNQKLEQSVEEKDARIDGLEKRLAELESRLDKVSEKAGQVNGALGEHALPTAAANVREQGGM